MTNEIFNGLGILYSIAVVCMIVVIIAMGVDLVSGWRKAKLRGEARTSYGLSRSLTKFLIYEGVLLISCGIDTMMHFAWLQLTKDTIYCIPLATILLAVVLCVVEGWSVMEKAEDKTRNRIDKALQTIIAAIGKDKAVEVIQDLMKDEKKDDTQGQ